jgi:hypothetical protein
VRKSTIYRNQDVGVWAGEQAQGMVVESELWENGYAVCASDLESLLTLTQCRLYDNIQANVAAYAEAEIILDHCQVAEHDLLQQIVRNQRF